MSLGWLQAGEDFLFDAAAALEHRLGLASRSTRIVPRAVDRYLVRVALIAVPLLCAALLVFERPLRGRVMLAILALALIAVIGIFVLEARRARSAAGGRPPTS
ncbi:MAG: hypothetical protein IBJ03_13600 [Gemmatimonadaceae bacterium]|nr:hypothetical protein [Gemmatimonadaceae bacterium]